MRACGHVTGCESYSSNYLPEGASNASTPEYGRAFSTVRAEPKRLRSHANCRISRVDRHRGGMPCNAARMAAQRHRLRSDGLPRRFEAHCADLLRDIEDRAIALPTRALVRRCAGPMRIARGEDAARRVERARERDVRRAR